MSNEILIDISAAVNQGAGIGRYARELTRALIPLVPNDEARLWYAAEPHPYDPKLLDSHPWSSVPSVRSRLSRRSVDRLYFRGRLPLRRLLGSGQPSQSYSPDFTAPPGRQTHITIHDLAWLHPEAETPPGLTAFLAPVVERAARSAATIFTVSNTIRTEILERYALSEDRLIVAPNAPGLEFFRATQLDAATLDRHGVHRPFVLYVGTIEPRKNLGILIEAGKLLPDGVQIVMAGRSGWRAEEIESRMSSSASPGRYLRMGFVPEDLLPRLMASASAVVYPSRYEGFGLPIVEALAAGVPVVASDLPVFREVGGEVVRYFDPANAEALATIVQQTISVELDPVARSARIEQAKQFDWLASAAIVAARLRETA
ncbi:MAG: glycosyltransferase family 4 protein [Thermomicrobiales bacterium]|nr:glycosyltransferase family 4 protein [Thermomicrobiales bacterium]